MRRVLLSPTLLAWLLASCGTPAPTTDDRTTASPSQNADDGEDDDGHDHEFDAEDQNYLLIRWNAGSNAAIKGYRIYKRIDEGDEEELVSYVRVSDADFDEDEPEIGLSESTLDLSP